MPGESGEPVAFGAAGTGEQQSRLTLGGQVVQASSRRAAIAALLKPRRMQEKFHFLDQPLSKVALMSHAAGAPANGLSNVSSGIEQGDFEICLPLGLDGSSKLR